MAGTDDPTGVILVLFLVLGEGSMFRFGATSVVDVAQRENVFL